MSTTTKGESESEPDYPLLDVRRAHKAMKQLDSYTQADLEKTKEAKKYSTEYKLELAQDQQRGHELATSLMRLLLTEHNIAPMKALSLTYGIKVFLTLLIDALDDPAALISLRDLEGVMGEIPIHIIRAMVKHRTSK